MYKYLASCGLYQESGKHLSTEKIPEFIILIFSVIHAVLIFTIIQHMHSMIHYL